jgi:LPS O-antigen subunit length determinant protein (WzzB/FepE family)
MNENNDELDLILLFTNLFQFWKRFGRLIITLSIIGAILGLVFHFTRPRFYSANSILKASMYNDGEQMQIIQTWSTLILRGEYQILSEELHCSPELLKNVRNISGRLIDRPGPAETQNTFTLDVVVNKTDILDSLQNCIVYGLENNEYIQQRVAIKRANTIEMIGKVKNEILKLDSTKDLVENIIQHKDRNAAPVIVDISSVNTQLINLNEKLLSYETELKLIDPIQVIHKFNKNEYPYRSRLAVPLAVGLLGGFLLGVFIAFYKILINKIMIRNQPKRENAKSNIKTTHH